MKKKVLISFFIIFLVLVLIGCSGVIPEIPDGNQEEKVKEIINNYWLALSNRQYELAKTYCIPNGNAYQVAEEYQDMPYIGSSTLVFNTYFNYIEINGNNAKANFNLTLTATVCFDDICSSADETLYNFSMYLVKINDIWKLK